MTEDIDDFWDDVRPHRSYVRNTPREERVKALAHKLWIARGSPSNGDPNIDWNEADRLTPQTPEKTPKSKSVWFALVGENVPSTRIQTTVPNDVRDSVDFYIQTPVLDRACTVRGVRIFMTETGGKAVWYKYFDPILLKSEHSMEIKITISISSSPSKDFLDLLRVPLIGNL